MECETCFLNDPFVCVCNAVVMRNQCPICFAANLPPGLRCCTVENGAVVAGKQNVWILMRIGRSPGVVFRV